MLCMFGCTFLQRVALRLARRVNCPFYLKIGACRHGARCSRKHIAPRMSTTVMFRQLYNNPKGHVMAAGDNPDRVKDEDVLESVRVLGCLLDFRVARVGPPPQFLDFTEDIFMEASEFGEVDDFMVFDNLADHLIGHVYIKFFREEDAQACLENLNGRWYGGRVVQGELTNASDFKAATCRQFFTGQCRFGFNCNFGHPKAIPKDFFEELQKEAPSYGKNERFAPATLGFAHDVRGGGGGGRFPGPPRRHFDGPPRGGGYDDRRGGYDDRRDFRRGGYDDRRDFRRGGYDDRRDFRRGGDRYDDRRDFRHRSRSPPRDRYGGGRDDRDGRRPSRSPYGRSRSRDRDFRRDGNDRRSMDRSGSGPSRGDDRWEDRQDAGAVPAGASGGRPAQ